MNKEIRVEVAEAWQKRLEDRSDFALSGEECKELARVLGFLIGRAQTLEEENERLKEHYHVADGWCMQCGATE